jgi:hypothetical protein
MSRMGGERFTAALRLCDKGKRLFELRTYPLTMGTPFVKVRIPGQRMTIMAVGVESVESSPSSDLLRQGRPRKAEDVSGVGAGAKGFFFIRSISEIIRSDPMKNFTLTHA